MRKFRFQFTLRTLFIFSFIFAIICAWLKCESDSKKNFQSTVSLIDQSLKIIQQEADGILYDIWLKEAEGNPTLHFFLQEYPSVNDRIPIVVGKSGCNIDTFSTEDFYWIIGRKVLSSKTDFSQARWKDHACFDFIAIDISITCHRPFSFKSQKTTTTITVRKATNNHLIIDPLKVELDKAGFSYDIREIEN